MGSGPALAAKLYSVPEGTPLRTLVWFRGKDLRLGDHEPLAHALAHGDVIPIFVLDPHFFAPERAQRIARRIQFLLDSLSELARER